MILDFIGFINTAATNLTTEEKVAMLNDFTDSLGYGDGIELTRAEFANEKIQLFIKRRIDTYRRKKAEEELSIVEFNM